MRLTLVLILSAFATACSVAMAGDAPAPAPAAKGGGDFPDHFKNLKVLPQDISKDELRTVMRDMNRGLGVKCNFCHQAEPRDWAADTKHKEIARGMLKMTDRINKEMFTWPKAPKATCYMCHHGKEEPDRVAPAEPAKP